MERARAKRRILNRIVIQGFVPIFVNDERDVRKLVEAVIGSGCDVLEYSCRRADAREMIPWIKREFPHVSVLAATLVDSPSLERFLSDRGEPFLTIEAAVGLGADALVSFTRFRPSTYERYGSDLVIIPGIHSANEALEQLDLGADLLKTSVLTVTGKEFISTVAIPTHRALPLFVSGGVTTSNVGTFVQEGIAVAAAGFDVLLPDRSMGNDDLPRAGAAAIRTMLDSIRSARLRHQPALAAAIAEHRTDVMAFVPWYSSNTP